MKKQIENIQPKQYKRRGIVYQSTNTQGTYHAEIENGKSIRIFGVCTNHVNGPQQFDRVFKIGDHAEYDSYNLKYNGKIIAIGNKTVTIKHYETSDRVTRLDVYEFVDRNWDFNLQKSERENSEAMYYL